MTSRKNQTRYNNFLRNFCHLWVIMLMLQHAVTSVSGLNCTLHREQHMQYQQTAGDTNFDLKSSAFAPIAGILEVVNRTLVNGVPLLTWRGKGEDEKGKRKKKKK